ncbi:hypothetical protein N9L48_01940 [Psychrosphaera sp.]|nr:hypothetical protein [Psychrosphaera sp.]
MSTSNLMMSNGYFSPALQSFPNDNIDVLKMKTRVLQEQLEQAVVFSQILSSKITLLQYFKVMCKFYMSYTQVEKRVLNFESKISLSHAAPYKTRLPSLESELSDIAYKLNVRLPIPPSKYLVTGNGSTLEKYWGIRYALDSFSQTAKMVFPKIESTLGHEHQLNLAFWKKLIEVDDDWTRTNAAINSINVDNIERSELVQCAQETFILVSENMAGTESFL